MPPFVFFGSSMFSVFTLDFLKEKGILPTLIVSTPDKPKGRKLVLTPTHVSVWAKENNIKCINPEKLKVEIPELNGFDFFLVASYGKIIPTNILDLPKKGVLNIHPSLLPKHRGASPIQTAILNDEKNTGISIMKLDIEMDHGPILGQKEITISEWQPVLEMKKIFAKNGVELFLEVVNDYLNGKEPIAQDHAKATFTKKIVKEDGLINLKDDSYLNYRKYCAYTPWPSVFYFEESEKDGKIEKTRIKISSAKYENGKFIVEKIIPEGKNERPHRQEY